MKNIPIVVPKELASLHHVVDSFRYVNVKCPISISLILHPQHLPQWTRETVCTCGSIWMYHKNINAKYVHLAILKYGHLQDTKLTVPPPQLQSSIR